MPGGAVCRIALVEGRFAGEGSHWGRGGGCRSIGVIRHRAVWMASGETRVFLGWAALVEFPVCAPVGRDGFWWDHRPRRRLDRWRSRGEFQAFEDPPGDVGVFDGGDQAQGRVAAGAEQGVDIEDALEQFGPTLAPAGRAIRREAEPVDFGRRSGGSRGASFGLSAFVLDPDGGPAECRLDTSGNSTR